MTTSATSTPPTDRVPDLSLAEAYKLLRKVGRYIPWPQSQVKTDKLPLIPMRKDEQGKTKAIEDDHFDRSVPYYLRGRRDEFNFLARRLVMEPGPIALVTAPPGFGKSALLAAVDQYAQCIGHTVVQLEAADLANAATIAQKCRTAVMTVADAPAHVIHRKSNKVTGAVTAAANKVFANLGLQISGEHERETTRQDVGDIDLIAHLQAVCQYQGKTHPLLILVDEVQDIQETIVEGKTQRKNIRTNLKILNDRILNKNLKLPITTILAGLDPAREIIRPLISRFASGSNLQLTPIATEHIHAILNDYLSIDDPREIPPNFYPPQKLQEWAESCQGHVLFANQLGYVIQEYALNKLANKQNRIDEDDLPDLQEDIDERRDLYYIGQLPKIQSASRAFDVVMHIVLATLNNRLPDNGEESYPITRKAAMDLAARAIHTYPQEVRKPRTDDLEDIMQLLQRSGIIRFMEPVDHFLHLNRRSRPKPIEHCDIPIPTITTHIKNMMHDELTVEDRNRIESNVHDVMQSHTLKPGTRWHWRSYKRRILIPKLRQIEYEPVPKHNP